MSKVTVTHEIVTRINGEMGDVLEAKVQSIPTLSEVIEVLRSLTFAVETVANLQGAEVMRPLIERSTKMIADLTPKA